MLFKAKHKHIEFRTDDLEIKRSHERPNVLVLIPNGGVVQDEYTRMKRLSSDSYFLMNI